jgi:hypothetical protein
MKKFAAALEDPYGELWMGKCWPIEPAMLDMNAKIGVLVGEARRRRCAAWKRTTSPSVLTSQ